MNLKSETIALNTSWHFTAWNTRRRNGESPCCLHK